MGFKWERSGMMGNSEVIWCIEVSGTGYFSKPVLNMRPSMVREPGHKGGAGELDKRW